MSAPGVLPPGRPDSENIADHRRAANEVVEFFGGDGLVLTGARVADIGCGAGITDLFVAAEARPALMVGFDIHPVDSQPLEDLVKETDFVEAYPDNLEFRQCERERLPADDASFDYAFSWSAFEHVANPLPVLREIRRVLRPGGILMIQVWPFFYSQHGSHLWDWFPDGFAPLLYDTETVVGKVLENPEMGPPWQEEMLRAYGELNRITVDELHRDLLIAGFRIGKLELLSTPVHIPPELECVPPSMIGISGVKLLAGLR